MNSIWMSTQQTAYNDIDDGFPVYSRAQVVKPTVVFTVGSRAAQFVKLAIEQGNGWLGTRPPVWQLDFSPQSDFGFDRRAASAASLRQKLNMLCAAVATEAGPYFKQNRHSTGGGSTNLLPLWLVLDLTDDSSGDCNSAETALQLLQAMDVVAWQRLQVMVQPQVLLVAKAGDQPRLDVCRQRLEVMSSDPYFVVGIEDGAEVALAQKVVTTVAALLWGVPDLATDAGRGIPANVGYYAVGAEVWPLPTAQLRRTLALRALLEAIHNAQTQLATSVQNQEAGAGGVKATNLVTETEQLLNGAAELDNQVPPPAAVAWGRGRPLWWRRALEPARILLAQRQVEQGTLRTAQRRVRQQWLATQLSAWEAMWQRFNSSELTSQHGVVREKQSDAKRYEVCVQQLWDSVLVQLQRIDECLATLSAGTTAAQATLQMQSSAVDTCCAGLPTMSMWGLWEWCTHPRAWGTWLWKLLVTLPRRLHALARAVAAYEAAVYQEANLHLVRQLGLAILQDVQLQLAWLPKVRTHLEELAICSNENLAQSLARLPAPWTDTRIAAVEQAIDDVAKSGGAGRTALDRLLQQAAAEEWTMTTTAMMAEELITAFANGSVAIEDWAIPDWLAAMFPNASDSASEQPDGKPHGEIQKSSAADALCTWLESLAEAAEPDWPRNSGWGDFAGWSRCAVIKEQGWLILPDSVGFGKLNDDGSTAKLDIEQWLANQQHNARLVAWLKQHPAWQQRESPIRGIAVVRQRPIA